MGNEHIGKYLWVYISIGLFIALLLPEIDPNNDTPLYVNTKHHKISGGFSHIVRIKYYDKREVRMNLGHLDIGIYESYVAIYFDSSGRNDYHQKMENILEDIMDVSTNIKFITESQFNNLKVRDNGTN